MFENILTFDDYDFNGKTALVRCDLNTPLDPSTGDFLEDRRMRSHKSTLQELSDKKAKTVIVAHQGRPGDSDFTTLESHAKRLTEILGTEVKYVEDIFGYHARNSVKNMNPGDIVLLENIRFYSEESLDRPADVQATTYLVKKMAPLADVFVNDAFGTAHRSHASTVGFTQVLPCVAGRLMEKELRGLSSVLKSTQKPLVFVLGGAKVNDSIKIMDKALSNDVEKILVGGLLANVFLAAKGYRIGDPSIEVIRGKKYTDQIKLARELLDKYEDKVVLPIDVALNDGGKRLEVPVSELPKDYRIEDVGKETVKNYVKVIKSSGTVFANGALGVYEDPGFSYATEEIIKALAECSGHSVIGGGDTVAAARNLNVEDKITHVSTGGKASIKFIAGDKLAAIEALRQKKA